MTIKGIFIECVKVGLVSHDIAYKKTWSSRLLSVAYCIDEKKLEKEIQENWYGDDKTIGEIADRFMDYYYIPNRTKSEWLK